uniref:Uncharacterized protein n=1 Tax=Monilinia fructicola TaxID=38448 RepID=A0A889XPT4_MONFR|nr:hypothetical protein KQ509_mgp13 [Monilinia fructicola]QRF72261.1 hypothetical protein [Monilinia fructicola]
MPEPNMETIRAKAQWRWDNGYRSKGLFTPVDIGQDGFDSNYTGEEISYLSQKVLDRGLDNTRPFAIQRYVEGQHRGKYRVVRLVTGTHEHRDTELKFTPVRPSAEFRAFLDTLN